MLGRDTCFTTATKKPSEVGQQVRRRPLQRRFKVLCLRRDGAGVARGTSLASPNAKEASVVPALLHSYHDLVEEGFLLTSLCLEQAEC